MNPADQSSSAKLTLSLLIGFIGLVIILNLLLVADRRPGASAAPVGMQSADGVWQEVDESLLSVASDRVIVPTAYRVVALNWDNLNSVLANVPQDLAGAAANQVILFLPLPDGRYGRFQIYQTSVMHPDLAAKFPQIRTYAGIGLDDPSAYARLDTTPKGFHAMILSANGRVFIDPYSSAIPDMYQSYFANDFVPTLPEDFAPDVVVEPAGETAEKPEAVTGEVNSGGTLRTYRLAVAATGEYTQFHGGTVELAMSEIATAVNRVAGIYEREVAVSLELIADNDQIVYTNGANDPYSNENGSLMLSQNQANLDTEIGSANYDIGHVFSTGGGGVAGLGVVCGSLKAWGVTGLISPVGDPFYVDYVAHEMGHQFSANHTFNSVALACNGNRNEATAYEPGSGSTIMGYAGICDPQNIQENSDDYFHTISLDEMITFLNFGLGNTCGTASATNNTPPTVDAGASFSIPLNTPFTLTGSATDPDQTAALTYNWEEFDLGPAGDPRFPSGNAPIFRSFPATSSPSRTFPQISDIVNNTQTFGELLPSYGRTMNFRLTVRDNQTPAGGVAYDFTTVTAVDGTGPFLVTDPNVAETWTGNTFETVSWNVAGTAAAPISCANVTISLSTDGGFTYPTILAASTPNDGSQSILVPNFNTSTARVRVGCADNIFFDISNVNFNIQLGEGGEPSLTVSKVVQPASSVAPGETLTYTILFGNEGTGAATMTTVADFFEPGLVDTECNGMPGDLLDMFTLDPFETREYTCTAVVYSSLALDVEITAVPSEIVSGEMVTYSITVTNSHSSLGMSNVQLNVPGVSNCTPAPGTPQTLGPGASQSYTCPANTVNSPAATTATATGELTITNVAMASDPEDPNAPASSETVASQIVVTGSDSVAVLFSDYFNLYLPFVGR